MFVRMSPQIAGEPRKGRWFLRCECRELRSDIPDPAQRHEVIMHNGPSAGPSAEPHPIRIGGLWGVRYQVRDVGRAVEFYVQMLGFSLDHQNLPAFGQVSIGELKLVLSGPGASGSRSMPDGRQQEPGGWTRVILRVTDLPACIAQLRKSGARLRNEMEVGPGGRQIQVEDPDGNPIELFEPADR